MEERESGFIIVTSDGESNNRWCRATTLPTDVKRMCVRCEVRWRGEPEDLCFNCGNEGECGYYDISKPNNMTDLPD